MGLYPPKASTKSGQLGNGKTFYVDPANGDDDYQGQTPNGAFATLQAAIDACTANKGDRIVRLSGTEIVTTSVLFNKAGITVEALETVGYSPYSKGERFMTYCSATDEPAAVISAPCVVKGIGFSSEYTGSGGHVCSIAGTGGFSGSFVQMKECRFTHWGSNGGNVHDEFLLINGPGAECYIEDSTFDGLFTAGLTHGAIKCKDHATGSDAWTFTVRRNKFINCTYGIVHESAVAPSRCLYQSNVFLATKILDNNGCTCTSVLVADNWSEYATNTGSYDDTVATLQGLGLSFSDNHYEE